MDTKENVKVKGVGMYSPHWEKVLKVKTEKGFDSMSETLRFLVDQYGKKDVKMQTAVKGA